MIRPTYGKYPDLSEVIKENGIDFKVETKIVNETSTDKVYTFDTHPFYSKLGDYSQVEFKDCVLK